VVVANVDRLGLIGQTVDGRYTIVEQIGEGGMGAVYRAQHNRLGRQVAIKFLHTEFAKDQEALARFFNEARAAATLGHPNIAESFDVGELADGAPFIVLELLSGHSVHDEIGRIGKLPIRRALRIARQIALGLDAAHQRGIIHRDLKSENVFLTDREENPDHVKILDFGVARVLENSTNITKPGHLIGTPESMPPEQIIAPDTIDARADVYAAGFILYHMLSGRKPYDAMPITALIYKILEDSPPPLTFLPDDVRKLVEDAMARDRNQRIQTMTELRDRIDACMAALSSLATPPPTRVPTDVTSAVVPAAAAASAAASAPQLAAPSVTTLPAQDAPHPAQRMARLALGVGGTIALAGVLSAVFHSRSHATGSPPNVPPPPPAQVATNPAAAPAVPDPPSTRPVGLPEVGPAVHAANPAPVPGATALPSAPPQIAVEARQFAPVNPPAASSYPHPATTRRAAAHLDPKGRHVPVTRLELAAIPTTPAPNQPSAASAEAPLAHAAGATEPAAATPPNGHDGHDEHGPATTVTSHGSGSPAAIAPAATPPTPAPQGPATPAIKKDEIDVAATRAAVRPHVAAIQQCYERAKMDDQGLAGAITVRITIAPDGAVTGAQIAKSTIGSSAVERCVATEISRWRLPKPTGGTAASFLYPFVFE
jgi:TonB family protein